MRTLALAATALLGALCAPGRAQSLDALRVGNWVEVKGELIGPALFRAQSLEVLPPDDEEVLLGVAQSVSRADSSFSVLGQRISVGPRTRWEGIALAELEGRRVKVEGHYRGQHKFSAREIAPRGEGRDRIAGRIDAISFAGDVRRATVLGFELILPSDLEFENEGAFDAIALAPQVVFESPTGTRLNDDDDYIPGAVALSDTLHLGALLEYKGVREDNYDLDDEDDEDETKQRLSLRAQLYWTPSAHFQALFSPRYEFQDVREEGGSHERTGQPHVNEAWVSWRDIARSGVDVRVGRLDFDEPREWVYDRNLDAVRFVWRGDALKLELSGSTVLDDGDDRDEHSNNWIAYLSNDDPERLLAAYVVDRRDDRSPRDYPIHFGARAIGEFAPDHESWLEASLLRGFSDNRDFEGYGFDVGTTWSPDFAHPLSFTLGFAYGSGDDDPNDGTDEAFRQTGLQDNNGKFAGVTSFRYYGEVLDPELSNLAIWTAGVGARVGPKTSVDLVYHVYDQVDASDFMLDSDVEADPGELDGTQRGLGHEIDLILGTKAWKPWDFEIVYGRFEPGDAFVDEDAAWLLSFQARFRF